MIVHDCQQNSLEWLALHVGVPTASNLDALLTPEFELRKGEMPKTLVYKKAAEAWRKEPLIELNDFSVEQGTIVEEEARPFYALETGQDVRQVGFITTDDGLCGCSPDGLIGEDNGLEIKCPSAHWHVKYLIEGVLPKEYRCQVYGSMFVTGYPRWTFMSYRRKFPPLILEISRDQEIMAKIDRAVKAFHASMANAKKRLSSYEQNPWTAEPEPELDRPLRQDQRFMDTEEAMERSR